MTMMATFGLFFLAFSFLIRNLLARKINKSYIEIKTRCRYTDLEVICATHNENNNPLLRIK